MLYERIIFTHDSNHLVVGKVKRYLQCLLKVEELPEVVQLLDDMNTAREMVKGEVKTLFICSGKTTIDDVQLYARDLAVVVKVLNPNAHVISYSLSDIHALEPGDLDGHIERGSTPQIVHDFIELFGKLEPDTDDLRIAQFIAGLLTAKTEDDFAKLFLPCDQITVKQLSM